MTEQDSFPTPLDGGLEPGRLPAGFDVVVRHIGGLDVTFPGEVLQDAYDVAINCLDFGSGFLSTEEVNSLRMLGRAIGAEPLHYMCKESPEFVIKGGPLKGTVMPAAPCTCGALER